MGYNKYRIYKGLNRGAAVLAAPGDSFIFGSILRWDSR